MAKILYTAGTYGHLKCFHTDYIEALKSEGHEVITMASGEGADIDLPFEKKMFSLKNLKNIRFNLVISTCGYLKIAPSSNLTSEVRNAILNAFKIIEQKQIPLYYNWWYYDQLIRAGKSITARDLQRVWGQSSASVNFGGYFYAWFFLLPGNEIHPG